MTCGETYNYRLVQNASIMFHKRKETASAAAPTLCRQCCPSLKSNKKWDFNRLIPHHEVSRSRTKSPHSSLPCRPRLLSMALVASRYVARRPC